MTPLLQAAEALVAALIDDAFYWAISEDFGTDLAARKVALKSYFCYSLEEAKRTGRCVIAPDPTLGAAAWLLPRTSDVKAKALVRLFLQAPWWKLQTQGYPAIWRLFPLGI